MKHFVSMTNTLKGVMKGDIDILDLQGATFHFGCAKEHFDIGVPHEATWCNVKLPVIYGSDQLNAAVDPVTSTLALEAVDEEFREKVMEFLSCVRAADAKGRVNYRIGNYPRYEAQLARDLTVSAAEGFLQPEILADAKIYTSRGEWSSFVVILKEAEADGTLESLRIAAKAQVGWKADSNDDDEPPHDYDGEIDF
jgi:hypothetical protein